MIHVLQDLFWYYVAKDQEIRAERERRQGTLDRHLWKSRKYPNSFLLIHTFLPFQDVCALYEVLYALERKNYVFFERLSLYKKSYKREVWTRSLRAHFLTFEFDELVHTTLYLPVPVENHRIMDLFACKDPR